MPLVPEGDLYRRVVDLRSPGVELLVGAVPPRCEGGRPGLNALFDYAAWLGERYAAGLDVRVGIVRVDGRDAAVHGRNADRYGAPAGSLSAFEGERKRNVAALLLCADTGAAAPSYGTTLVWAGWAARSAQTQLTRIGFDATIDERPGVVPAPPSHRDRPDHLCSVVVRWEP